MHNVFECLLAPKLTLSGEVTLSRRAAFRGVFDVFLRLRAKDPPRHNPCIVVENKTSLEDLSSCGTRRHVLLFNKKICLPAQEEDMSWSTRTHVFLSNKTTCLQHVFLLDNKACLLFQQEVMSCCWERNTASLSNGKTCLQEEEMPSSCTRRAVFF